MTACSPRIHVDSRSSKLWGRGKPGLDKCFSPPCCDSPGNGVQTGWWTHGKRQSSVCTLSRHVKSSSFLGCACGTSCGIRIYATVMILS